MSTSKKTFQPTHTSESRKDIHTLPKTTTNDYKIVCTHLIDGVYQGFVNASYQRDGFGILQTDDYQTYMGYFKYNRPNGLGLIFYTDGSVIYANFHHGQLEGIGLADNGTQLQIGTFRASSLVGIGFEYSYIDTRWKMNSYHKGVSIEVIREEQLPLEDGIPNILTLESEVLSHYLNYSKKRYFSKSDLLKTEIREDINAFYVHRLGEEQYFFGCMISNKFDGLALTYNFKNKRVCEVGTYREGALQDQKTHSQEQGFYHEGRREGVFIVNQGGKTKFMQYKKGNVMTEDKRGEDVEAIRKRQKIYYYRQKDFLSTRNNLDLYALKSVFESSEYKAWKIQEQADKKQKPEIQKPATEGKIKKKPSNGGAIVGMHGFEKSSVQIMKEKIFGLISQNESKKNKNDKTNLLFQKDSEDLSIANFQKGHEDDEIAEEESPIQIMVSDAWPKKRPVTFQSYESRYG